jgi:predicted dehydrogenase
MTENNAAPIRIALVGCGAAGLSRLIELLQVPDVEVAALVDPNPAAVANARAAAGVLRETPGFSDLPSMLAEVRLDGVMLVTPHALHAAQIRACLETGRHVLVEKPFVLEPDDARSLVELAEQKGLVLCVGFQLRGHPAFRYMCQVLRDGRIGPIRFVHAHFAQNYKRQFLLGTWRADPAMAPGGQLNDSGAHVFDIVTWLVGERPREVTARADTLGERVEVNGAVTIRFAGGALANVAVIGDCPPGGGPSGGHDFIFYGDKGWLAYRAGRVLEQTFDGEGILDVRRLPAEVNLRHNFVEAIRGTATPVVSARETIVTVELARAIRQAVASGLPVVIET